MRTPETNKDVVPHVSRKSRTATLKQLKRAITLPTTPPPQSWHSSHWLVASPLEAVGVEKNGTFTQHYSFSKG